MDELTIGDKTYVSSKRAAKITGYAKDYVGQLCREGRVEAKLVGRNWYVLEASIREHRFGLMEEVHDVAHTPASGTDRTHDITWGSVQYESETPQVIPVLSQQPIEPESQEPRQVVLEMQSAWQEWFAAQDKSVAGLEDQAAEEDMLTDTAEASEEEPVVIQHLPPKAEVHIHALIEETYIEQVQDISPAHDIYGAQEHMRSSEASESTGSNLLLRSVFVSLAFVAVLVALVGTGVIGDVIAASTISTGNTGVAGILGGSFEYKSIK